MLCLHAGFGGQRTGMPQATQNCQQDKQLQLYNKLQGNARSYQCRLDCQPRCCARVVKAEEIHRQVDHLRNVEQKGLVLNTNTTQRQVHKQRSNHSLAVNSSVYQILTTRTAVNSYHVVLSSQYYSFSIIYIVNVTVVLQ